MDSMKETFKHIGDKMRRSKPNQQKLKGVLKCGRGTLFFWRNNVSELKMSSFKYLPKERHEFITPEYSPNHVNRKIVTLTHIIVKHRTPKN